LIGTFRPFIALPVSSSIEDGHLREGNDVLAIELFFQLLKG
jgi:hypothetical protein